MQEYIVQNEQQTVDLAKKIADQLSAGNVLAFYGELGAGKTFLCRQIIQSLLQDKVNVASPTFNLLQTYKAEGKFTIYHYDLYRLKDPSEIFEIGFEEAMDDSNICLIEWPEIINSFLPKDVIKVNVSIIDENQRKIVMS